MMGVVLAEPIIIVAPVLAAVQLLQPVTLLELLAKVRVELVAIILAAIVVEQ